MPGVDIDNLFDDHRINANLAWIFVGVLLAITLFELAVGDLMEATTGIVVVILSVLPGPFYRTYTVTLPWEIVAGITGIVGWFMITPGGMMPLYLIIVGIAFLLAFELHLFTSVHMSHRFAIVFVLITTSAVAGIWAIIRWLSDVYLGTSFLPGHTALMWEFVYLSAAGLVGGVVFDIYVYWWEKRFDKLTPLIEE